MSEVLDGMEMDLTQSRYLDETGLNRYCHCVAGVVGTLSARLFGYSDPHTLVFAEKLGLSLQLVNILRDVGETRAAAASTCRWIRCSASRCLPPRFCRRSIPSALLR